MKTASLLIGMLGLTVALVPRGFADQRDQKITPDATDALEVQTRGPLHEAYAVPANSSPRPGPVVDKKPPDSIKELPPDQKPEGDDVQWIPGYWAWDTDRNDFTWVSGFWRVPPPNRKWVPGHWSEADGGWRWAPGFWAPAAQEQLSYIDEAPPDSLDNGPSVPAPDDDSQYVPGSWVYQSNSYAWQPGYWATAQLGYIWTPPRYCWTPSGYCYVNGYWDYPLEDRGLLFAPVCFNSPLWTNPDWIYQPSYCLPFGGLLSSLFCRPGWGSYYFGDYYGAGYFNQGFYPWFAYGRHWHDPLFGYYNWRNRDNPGWYRGLAGDYRSRLAGDLPRAPRTFAQQNALVQRFNNGNIDRHTLDSLQTVKPLSQLAGNGVHLAKLTPSQADAARRTASAFGQVGLDRQRLERPARAGAGRPAALSLAHVPTPTARGPATASGLGSRSGTEPRGYPNPAAGTGARGTPGLNRSNGQPNPGFRDAPGTRPFVNRSGGPSNPGRNQAQSSPHPYSAPSHDTPRSQRPAPSSTSRGASSYRAPARPSAPNYSPQAPPRTSQSYSRPTNRAAPSYRGASGGGGGHSSGPSGGSGGGHSSGHSGGGGGGHSSGHSGGGSGGHSSGHSGGHSSGHSGGGGGGHSSGHSGGGGGGHSSGHSGGGGRNERH